ncbi:hypothetical protein BGZ63DRAFT_21902 [Mariannaea sp. PMI_226]|nr:hypothetical protein BGZ63DRAFT_21902 [Mariannaea sp. PMI_226]
MDGVLYGCMNPTKRGMKIKKSTIVYLVCGTGVNFPCCLPTTIDGFIPLMAFELVEAQTRAGIWGLFKVPSFIRSCLVLAGVYWWLSNELSIRNMPNLVCWQRLARIVCINSTSPAALQCMHMRPQSHIALSPSSLVYYKLVFYRLSYSNSSPFSLLCTASEAMLNSASGTGWSCRKKASIKGDQMGCRGPPLTTLV